MLCYRNFKTLEGLTHDLVFLILGDVGKDIDYNGPARFNVFCLGGADAGYAHHDILFDFVPHVIVGEHDLFEGVQEVLLEVEAGELGFQ